MGIFNWGHRKFPKNPNAYNPKASFEDPWRVGDESPNFSKMMKDTNANERTKKAEDMEALLHKKYQADMVPFNNNNNWDLSDEINGLLAIGTLGIVANAKGSMEDEMQLKMVEEDEELFDHIEMEVLEGKLVEAFGVAKSHDVIIHPNKKAIEEEVNFEKDTYEVNISTQRNMYPLQDYFELQPFVEVGNNKAKKEKRTTLADLFAKGINPDNTDGVKCYKKQASQCENVVYAPQEETKKANIIHKKHSKSFLKKITNWKGEVPTMAKQWMKKMLYKKIHPEEGEQLQGVVKNTHVDVTKTCVKNHEKTESVSIQSSRDNDDMMSLLQTMGNQEYWIKTDSEYVVLEL